MTTQALAAGFAALGLAGTVEARGSLAILTVSNATSIAAAGNADLRASAVALAARHGYAALALELAPNAADDRAPLPGS